MIHIYKYSPRDGLTTSEVVSETVLHLGPEESIWVDLEDPTPAEERILRDHFRFHPLEVEDTDEEQYPKIDHYEDHIFVVFHGIDYASSAEFTTSELAVFLGHQYLVTHHDHRMRSVRQIRTRLRENPKLMGRGMDVLLHSIIDHMVDNYFPELEKLEDRIEELEEEIVDRPTRETLNRIFDLKREVLQLKKVVHPQRDVFRNLSRADIPYIQDSTQPYFRDTYDNLFRMTTTADSYRDLLTTLLDAYLSSLSQSSNDVMKVLTLIATICIPMTVVQTCDG